ncbi:MAG TPA: hypothetical protein VJZ00_06215 [Thermoanaerobaculia bacterium]|nr:hypothetical protein [Thermoanaerobaculia bacterium]
MLALALAWGCATAPRDACALVTPAEVEQLQGERPVEAKPADQPPFHQCFYKLPTFTKSITIGYAKDADELLEEHETEAGEESGPRKIEGVGDEAFWASLPIGGTLYVRQGEVLVRVGLGGTDADNVRLEKATSIARIMLRRLR